MSNRLGGKQGTAYLGTNANQPPNWHFNLRNPDQYDNMNYSLGDLWLNQLTKQVFVLVSLANNGQSTYKGPQATWVAWAGPNSDLQTLTGDAGGPVPPDGAENINVLGAHNINTLGDPLTSTLTVAVNNTITLGDLVTIDRKAPSLTLASGCVYFRADGLTANTSQAIVYAGQAASIFMDGTNINDPTTWTPFLISSTSVRSTMMGYGCGVPPSTNNSGFGYNTLKSVIAGASGNSAFGAETGASITTGSNNLLMGFNTLPLGTTASFNMCLGSGSFLNLLTGNYNAGIGYEAGMNYTGAESNNVLLANPGTVGESNVMRLGTTGSGQQQVNKCFIAGVNGVTPATKVTNVALTNADGQLATTGATKTFISGVRGVTTDNADAIAVLIDSAGQLGTVSSSIRYKQNVEDLGDYSEEIYNLKPRVFEYKKDRSQRKNVGLIAEEVLEILPDMVIMNDEGEPETVRYQDLPILLLNEIIKLRRRIIDLENNR